MPPVEVLAEPLLPNVAAPTPPPLGELPSFELHPKVMTVSAATQKASREYIGTSTFDSVA